MVLSVFDRDTGTQVLKAVYTLADRPSVLLEMVTVDQIRIRNFLAALRWEGDCCVEKQNRGWSW